MATFEPTIPRIRFAMTIRVRDFAQVVMVADDGWKLWLQDEKDGHTLYTLSFGVDSNRTPDRESAIGAIQNRCGWWDTRKDLFTDPPKFHEIPRECSE